MITAFQINAFQNNAFQIAIPSGNIYYDGGPGGSDKAGRKHRRKLRYAQSSPENPYQIPWGKNSELLLDLLPQDTIQDDWISDVVEQYADNQSLIITSINSLLLSINSAIIAYEQDFKQADILEYKRKLVHNYRKAKRKQDDEEMICLLICM